MTETLTQPDTTRADLLRRLADALAAPEAQSLDAMVALIDEAQHAAGRAQTEAAEAREAALDSALSHSEAQALRQKAEETGHDAARMAHAFARLEAALSPRIEHEKEAARKARYQAAAEATDRCAERIRKDWPQVQAQLLDLVSETMRASAAVDAANQDPPQGAKPLERPEGAARGFRDRGPRDLPLEEGLFRLTSMTIPALEPDRLAWPLETTVARAFNFMSRQTRQCFSEVTQAWKERAKLPSPTNAARPGWRS